MKNYYEILNININASKQDIKKAYRILAVKYHPDKNNGDKYLTQKFIEVQEAYETLINSEKRKEYDIEYVNNFEASKENSKKTSFEENITDDFTPQYPPTFDLFGNKIFSDVLFFKLPKKIGILTGAYSDFYEGHKPLTENEKKNNIIIGIVVAVIVYLLIFFIGNPSTTWSVIWFVVVVFASWLVLDSINTFSRKNLFVGTNGFAEFEMMESKDNIIKDIEINFKDVTDLYVKFTEVKKNFEYQHTKYEYVFYNNGKEILSRKGDYKKNENKRLYIELNFLEKIEQSYTIFLLNSMEKQLAEKGYILFRIKRFGSPEDYIKLGIGEITFIKDGKDKFTYNYEDIKSVYTRGNDLYIEHSNFERKFYFIKSGNADKIPLLDICNRNFFFKAFEILLGYSMN